ncbi:MAG: RNA-guided pseudouridylation complex pseudouridine synthase subunit Cbf5 [Candidatus Thermoplasmatota archaeon]|nr:RNA-guided pseudouridylation complex pseudouridine synthase subunit Cbf5 [Candidatus Thermoplasmatota archaeon]
MVGLLSEEHLVVKVKSETTDKRYGCEPEKRLLSEYIKLGCINLDKPRGPTSHQVVAWVKDIINIEKAGHGGTLDPKVTGVLPLALGNATKALQAFLYGTKEYIGIMRTHRDVSTDDIKKICSRFVGEIEQLPPVRAAVKREVRKRKIYSFDILEIEKRDVLFKVICQAGTYIRTLVHNVGKLIGGSHLEELRRTRSCSFEEREAITLHQLKDAYMDYKEGNERELRKVIMPFEKMLSHLPKIIIRDSAVDAVCHGANLAIPGFVKFDKRIEKGSTVAIFSLKNEAVALGKSLLSSKELLTKSEGCAVDIERVFMLPNTYPPCWKKKI